MSAGASGALTLVTPSREYLAAYVDALERGWCADTLRASAAAEERAEIKRNADAFLEHLDDPEGKGPPIRLPDGSLTPRLPGVHRWLWDGSFCGSINLRWRSGTPELPPTCPGHIGYSVVPWKRGRGYAKAALAQMLPEARNVGLPYVDLITDADNAASQRVIVANGGILVERFTRPKELGCADALRYRIAL